MDEYECINLFYWCESKSIIIYIVLEPLLTLSLGRLLDQLFSVFYIYWKIFQLSFTFLICKIFLNLFLLIFTVYLLYILIEATPWTPPSPALCPNSTLSPSSCPLTGGVPPLPYPYSLSSLIRTAWILVLCVLSSHFLP